MATWESLYLTNQGRALNAKVESGTTKKKYTRIEIGAGRAEVSLIPRLVDIIKPLCSVPITSSAIVNDTTPVLSITIYSENLKTSIMGQELGLFAEDDSGKEVLYAYITTTPDDPIMLTAGGMNNLTINLNISSIDPDKVTPVIAVPVGPASLADVANNISRHNLDQNAHPIIKINDWLPNTMYSIDTVCVYNSIIYRAIIDHTSSKEFELDMSIGSEKWIAIGGGGSAKGGSNFTQVTKFNITNCPQTFNLPITYSSDFCKPKPEVLKFVASSGTHVVTECNFDSGDDKNFTVDNAPATNSDLVVFDGTLHPNYNFTVHMNPAEAFKGGYIQASDYIDLDKWQSVTAVNIE